MHHITKMQSLKLKAIADNMRLIMVNTHEKHLMTKEELEEIGHADAEQLPNGTFIYRAPVQIAMNHFRALKNAFKKNSFEGCLNYINKINAL